MPAKDTIDSVTSFINAVTHMVEVCGFWRLVVASGIAGGIAGFVLWAYDRYATKKKEAGWDRTIAYLDKAVIDLQRENTRLQEENRAKNMQLLIHLRVTPEDARSVVYNNTSATPSKGTP